MIGLTSVTFRNLSPEQIISLAKECGLDGIEWGADVHVPAGRVTAAHQVRHGMEKAGLKVLSYGSYYRLCENTFPKDAFMAVVMSADMLHAPNIRIWAGALPPEQAHEDYYERAAKELKVLCRMAALFNITVSLEYHPGSLTQDCHSALKLLKLADCENLKTYWQPNPKLTFEQNAEELKAVLPYLSNVHVFHLSGTGERLPLAEGSKEWREYIGIASGKQDVNFIMEFVKNDAPEAFVQDAAVLHRLMEE